MTSQSYRIAALAAALCGLLSAPATADEEEAFESLASGQKAVRVTLGADTKPKFPGSDERGFGPLVNVDTKEEGGQFYFEAPDESFDFYLFESGGFAVGPVLAYEGSRTANDVGAMLDKIDFSLEPGIFAQYQMGESFRVRSELRKGVTGHKGWIADLGADFIMREGDQWLFSIGPRLTWSDDRYNDTWFGVTPADSATSGLPVHDPDGGIQSYGATATFLTQFSEQWGIYTWGKYARLTGDAADSPIVTQLGSRDQFSGGVGLSYTFNR